MKVIAVTGGIASGKSTVAKIFNQKYNIPIIDTDLIAGDLLSQKEIINQISNKFGNTVLDKKMLNKKKLRELIFNNKENKKWLEDLLHPLINNELRCRINALKAENKYKFCLALIPLINREYLEKNDFIDKVLVVDCDEKQQLKRAMTRDNQSKEQIEKIIKNQITRAERIELADYVIENNNTERELHEKISKLFNQIT